VSEQNVEIVRRLYAIDTSVAGQVFRKIFPEFFHPDAEMVPPPIYPDTESSYHGVEGFLRWQQQLDEIWNDWRVEAERFFDAGDHVVAFVRVSGTAKKSQAAVGISTAHVLTLREDRVTRVEIFLDRHDALKVVGLE
jgi:ketosteroid isomerase-like protein